MKKIFLILPFVTIGLFLASKNKKHDCERIFTKLVMVRHLWGGDSLSGPGSDLTQTKAIREALPALLENYQCKILVDAPCGDLYWIQKVTLPVEKYIGIEVVKELVVANQNRFGDSKHTFLHLDLTKQLIPQADLVLCRDCLVHLSYDAIAKVVRLFKKSGSTYLLTTSFPNREENQDIRTGKWRPLNLRIAPFNFPEPLTTISEKCTEESGLFYDKSLMLWKIEDLPDL